MSSIVSTASIDTLARLMAGEDLSVQHNPLAETASFDMNDRVLTLPVWDNMSRSLYDMLVGHEVAHALWTPFESTTQFFADIAKVGSCEAVAKDFINIVEDARIERMIKAKYPGIKRDFVRGYDELMQRDLFGIPGNVNDMRFIDRLNIHFKVGALAGVQFSDVEQAFVDRMAKVSTWDEVLDLARDLYNYCAETEGENQPQPSSGSAASAGAGQESEDSVKSEAGGSESGADGDEQDSSSGDEQGDAEGEANGKSNGGDEGDSDSEDAGAAGSQGVSSQGEFIPQGSDTQRAMERAVQDMADKHGKQQVYGQIPAANLDNMVIRTEKIGEKFDSIIASDPEYVRSYENTKRKFAAFRNDSQKIVGQMAQWFEMKRRADEDRNTMTSLTGEIDLERLVDYKFAEDIFLRNEVMPEGQNHGIVVMIDWSGSMGGIMGDTVRQALQLIWFCERVNIPCEVYAFTSQVWEKDGQDRYGHDPSKQVAPRWDIKNGKEFMPDDYMNLLQFYRSDLRGSKRTDALHRLYHLARYNDGKGRFLWGGCLGLGGTPLTEGMMAMDTVLPDFRNRYGIQILNLCVLSDGEGTARSLYSNGGGYGCKVHIEDPKSRRRVALERGDGSAEVADILRIRHDVNCIGFYVTKAKKCPYFRGLDNYDVKVQKSWKDDKFVSHPHGGFADYFVMQSQDVENDPLDNLSKDATITKVRNAFIKGAKSLKTSRIVLSRVIDIIA